MPKIKLSKLQCIVNDEIDKDEVYLKYNGEKIWPENKIYKRIDNAETFEVDVIINHPDTQTPMVIQLWDFDYLSFNDFLGEFQMLIGNDTSGSFSTSMEIREKGSTASYILFWEILG